MRVRPKLTGAARVVAWVYAIFGALAGLTWLVRLGSDAGYPDDFLVAGFVSSGLFLVSGVGILGRARWAWWVAVVLTAFYLAISPFLAVEEVTPGLVMGGLAAIALACLTIRGRASPVPGADHTQGFGNEVVLPAPPGVPPKPAASKPEPQTPFVTGPPNRKPGFSAGIVIGVVGALAAAALGFVAATQLGDDAGPASPSPSPSASPSPSPSPAKKPARNAAVVIGQFHDNDGVQGNRLLFGVGRLDLQSGDCTTHAYTHGARTWAAFESDCASWEPEYDILLFRVGFRNHSQRAVGFNLRNFVLTARDGRTFGPVNVRLHAEYPPNFLPERAKIPPRSDLLGWLTFDGRVTGMVPARLSYVDGRQTLTIIFQGRHSIH